MANPNGTRGATVERSNALRKQVLALGHLSAKAVAEIAGCSVKTVHKIRRNPGADGRSKRREAQRVNAALRQIAEPSDPTIDDLVPLFGDTSKPWRPVQAGEVVAGDPYSDLALPGYDVARGAETRSLAPEIGLLRARIRETAGQLCEAESSQQMLRLQEHLASLSDTLARLVRAHSASEGGSNDVADAMGAICEDILDGRGL